MHISEIIALAEKHVEKAQMLSSAKLCLSDAKELVGRGEVESAKVRALKSLAYSIGILHPDYRAAAAR